MRERERASIGVGLRVLGGRAADLDPHPPLEVVPDRPAPLLEAPLRADRLRKLAIPERQVGDGVERGRAGEHLRMAREQEERLLATHARPHRIDAPAVDAEPRHGLRENLRHACEIFDLARVAPREATEPAAVPLGVDDREASARRQVAPEAHVLAAGDDAAAVRGDHERQRAARARPIRRGQEEEGAAPDPVVGPVRDGDDAYAPVARGAETEGGRMLGGGALLGWKRPGRRGRRGQDSAADRQRGGEHGREGDFDMKALGGHGPTVEPGPNDAVSAR